MRCVPGSCSPGSVSELALVLEVARVDLDVTLPLVRELVLGEAGVHGAGLDAGVAVDALLRIDVQLLDLVVVRLVRSRVDAVDGADLDARVVLLPDAGLCDHIRHVAANLANGTRELTFRQMAITSRILRQRGKRQAEKLGIDPERVPPGQSLTERFPVLTGGPNPPYDL